MATLKVPHNLFHSPGLRPELAVHQGVRGPGQLLPAAVRAPQLQVVEAGPVPVGHLPADARQEARPRRAQQERVHAQDGDPAEEGVQLLRRRRRRRHHRHEGRHGREVALRRRQRHSQGTTVKCDILDVKR